MVPSSLESRAAMQRFFVSPPELAQFLTQPGSTNAEAEDAKERSISTRITQVVLRATIALLTGLGRLFRSIGVLIVTIIHPLRWVGRALFVVALRPAYRMYRVVRSHLARLLAPAKNRWLFFLLHRSTVTIAVSTIAVLVALNNVQAETTTTNFGRQSIFATLFSSDLAEEVEVVEGLASLPLPNPDEDLALTPTTTPQRRTVSEESSAMPENAERQLALGIGGAVTDVETEEVRYYIVEGGDTISTIAEKFSVATSTILWENKLSETDYIKPGQKLTILPVDGVTHTVKKGDTVATIAKKYKATEDKILAFNRLASGEALNEGEELIVPEGVIDTPSAPAPSQPSSTTRRIGFLNVPPPARVTPGARFQWPTSSRRINQYYKFRHTGIDIDGDVGSPVYAADSGVVESVVYARYGYGFHVVINHGGGRETLYAHNARMYVKPGQSVKRGQTIAVVGLTGRTTGAHLHFEVIVNGGKRNPLSYL